jgi:hypothetical protein
MWTMPSAPAPRCCVDTLPCATNRVPRMPCAHIRASYLICIAHTLEPPGRLALPSTATDSHSWDQRSFRLHTAPRQESTGAQRGGTVCHRDSQPEALSHGSLSSFCSNLYPEAWERVHGSDHHIKLANWGWGLQLSL